MPGRRGVGALLSGAVLAVATTCLAGDVAVRVHHTLADGSGQTFDERRWWGDRRAAIAGPGRRIVIDLDAGTLTSVWADPMRYRVFPLPDLAAQAIESRLTARHMVRTARHAGMDARGADPGGRFVLRPTGRTETIAGVAAAEYAVESQLASGSVWLAPSLRPRPALALWLSRAADLGGLRLAGTKLALALVKRGGVPLRAELRAAGGVAVRSEVTELGHESLPARLLALPEGAVPTDDPFP
jgi:hypothetical protein